MNDIYKNKLIECLIEIDRVCNENGLRYYLTGGTLLGAIRHKGFIPWDDDIDIAMPRSDYEKLRNIASVVFEKKFRLVTIDEDKNYYCRFAKLYHQETTLVEFEHPFYLGGLYVDVFPLDGLPKDEIKRKKHFIKYTKALNILYRLYSHPIKISEVNSLRGLLRYGKRKIYGLLYSIPEIIKVCEKTAKTYPFEESEYVANLSGAWGEREITKREYFDEHDYAEFEGRKYRIPKGYHMLLTGLYGDYLQLPPIEKQVSHHSRYFMDLTIKIIY